MQRIIIFICAFIVLISCGRNQYTKASQNIASEAVNQSNFIHVLLDSAHYGDTHAYSQCHGRYWELFGEQNDTTYFGALTLRITNHEFDSITEILNKSFGKYTYDDKTAPIDSAYFWMGTKSYTKYYYWLTGDILIAWGLFEVADSTGYAHLDIRKRESAVMDNQTSFPQITSFADYVFEEHLVFAQNDSDSIGHLRQLDIEFPTDMKDKKVLARIQEQLIDTLFNEHYHTAKLDNAVAKYWSISPDMIECKTTYPHAVPDDSDEYFEYGGVNNIHFEHICGRTSYNKNGLYIMRHHYAWFDGGNHHFPNTSYIAFDTRTGKIIHFLDIFSEEFEDHEKKMTYSIDFYVSEALLKKYPNISTQYWKDASFTITHNALVLHYTHYTLGCWADGEQEIEIRADKAKLFLNNNWKLLFQ